MEEDGRGRAMVHRRVTCLLLPVSEPVRDVLYIYLTWAQRRRGGGVNAMEQRGSDCREHWSRRNMINSRYDSLVPT